MYPLIQNVAKFRSKSENYKMDFYPELVIFSVAIVIKLYKQRNFLGGNAFVTTSKLAKQASVMLLAVAGTFIVLTLPLPIFRFISMGEEEHISSKFNENPIVILLTMTNHSINAALYIISGSKYRQSVIKMFRCKKYKRKNRVGIHKISVPQNVMMRQNNRNMDTLQVPQSRLRVHI